MEWMGKKDGVFVEGAVLSIILDFLIEIRVVYGYNSSGKALLRAHFEKNHGSLNHQRLSINLQNCASIISYYII